MQNKWSFYITAEQVLDFYPVCPCVWRKQNLVKGNNYYKLVTELV